ncbi:hypothetical protein ACQKLX_21690 [Bosea sp. NPDC003192]|uniref:hypothetical protein n=1 Tax=Bosea sp. NPDC003192 TaxID=3390551 RepID=UPI003D008DF3
MVQPKELAKVSLGAGEIAAIKQYMAGGAPYWSRLSLALCIRLIDLESRRGEARDVLDEIEALEGLRAPLNTKPAAPFRRPPLKGFWHKHFSTSRHFVRNIGERWGIAKGGNKELRAMIEESGSQSGSDIEKMIMRTVHRFVIGGASDRSQANRLTGDWIIFAKNKGGENVYLDLATHEEGQNAPDQLVQKLIEGSEAEFPEVFAEILATP